MFRRFGTHNSTHVDAPWHYNSTIEGKPAQTIDELPLEWFFAPGVVLDFSARADGEAVTAARRRGRLPRIGHDLRPLDIVLVRTGRDAFYAAPDYMIRGPGVTAEATHWLFERGVRVMGIDAWGWDAPLDLQAAEAKARNETGIFWAAHQADLPTPRSSGWSTSTSCRPMASASPASRSSSSGPARRPPASSPSSTTERAGARHRAGYAWSVPTWTAVITRLRAWAGFVAWQATLRAPPVAAPVSVIVRL